MKWDGICVLPPLPSHLLPRCLATDATWPFFPSSSMPSSFLSQGLCTRGFLLLETPDLPMVGSFSSLGPQLRCHLLGGALCHHSIQMSPPPSIALHCINPVRFLSQQVSFRLSGFCTYCQAPGETVLVWLIHGHRAVPGPQQVLSG